MEEYTEPRILRTKKDADEFLYQTPYFAFLDILGFSTLVRNNSHDSLVKLYEGIFSAQVEVLEQKLKELAQKTADSSKERYTDSNLRMVNISDSILIWTSHGQPSALFEIVYSVSTLMGISLVQGLPLRGCITRQPFSVIEKGLATSVIGKGLIHAYNMEKAQQWSGCVVDAEIIRYFRSIEKVLFSREAPSPIERDEMVYEYDIPIKTKEGDSTEKGYAVNWSHALISDAMVVDSFSAHNKKDDRRDSDTPQKIENTLAFHHFCQENAKKKKAEMDAWNVIIGKDK